jgi:hypothetical protein
LVDQFESWGYRSSQRCPQTLGLGIIGNHGGDVDCGIPEIDRTILELA